MDQIAQQLRLGHGADVLRRHPPLHLAIGVLQREAEAVLINGSVTEKVLNYVNQSSANTLIGTKEGKGFEASEDLTVWFAEVHR